MEQRAGKRLLTVAGVLQGSADVDPEGRIVQDSADPTADLLRNKRQGRALVVGLGTGRTAASLHARRYEVRAVEIDPGVVAIARRYFALPEDLKITVGDGATFLEQNDERHELVIVDAFSGSETPAALRADRALRAIRRSVGAGGVVAFRLIASPADDAVADLQRRLGFRYSAAFAAGAANEVQPLVLIASNAPLDIPWLVGVHEGYRLVTPGHRSQPDDEALGTWSERVGYLALVNGQPCLDLPHTEMGAVRFRLLGPPARALVPKLRALEKQHAARLQARRARARGKAGLGQWDRVGDEEAFPTSGDLSSDGDLSRTLAPLLGGGGVKRNEVRFSPIVARARGWARSNDDPELNASVWGPGPGFRRPPGQPAIDTSKSLLPHGGWLYDLNIAEAPQLFELPSWKRLQAPLRALASEASRALKAGRFDAAATTLERYGRTLGAALGDIAPDAVAHREILALARLAQDEATSLPPSPSPLQAAAACDRVASSITGFVSPDADVVVKGAHHCAEAGYERVLESSASGAGARALAGRRLHGLLSRWFPHESEEEVRRRSAREEELTRRWSLDSEWNDEPPLVLPGD